MILYRPIGLEELVLVYRSGLRRFPPRLPEQPIFYPVLELEYARKIARQWNTTSGSKAGYVVELEVDDAYSSSFQVRQVGDRSHRELWVPAEALDEFNGHIIAPIRLVDAFFGSDFTGLIPAGFSLRGKNARDQLASLVGIHQYSLMDFHGEVVANSEVVFVHYPFWAQVVAEEGQDLHAGAGRVLEAIREVWGRALPDVALGLQAPRVARTP